MEQVHPTCVDCSLKCYFVQHLCGFGRVREGLVGRKVRPHWARTESSGSGRIKVGP